MRRVKYFVLLEGSDRAILRTKLNAAYKKKKKMEQFNPGKKVHIFAAERKIV